eukprot:2182695-Prymnesium_polylepis.1
MLRRVRQAAAMRQAAHAGGRRGRCPAKSRRQHGSQGCGARAGGTMQRREQAATGCGCGAAPACALRRKGCARVAHAPQARTTVARRTGRARAPSSIIWRARREDKRCSTGAVQARRERVFDLSARLVPGRVPNKHSLASRSGPAARPKSATRPSHERARRTGGQWDARETASARHETVSGEHNHMASYGGVCAVCAHGLEARKWRCASTPRASS